MAGGGWRGPQWSIGRATYPVVVRCWFSCSLRTRFSSMRYSMTCCWWRLTHPARVTSSRRKGERSAVIGRSYGASFWPMYKDGLGRIRTLRPAGRPPPRRVGDGRVEPAGAGGQALAPSGRLRSGVGGQEDGGPYELVGPAEALQRDAGAPAPRRAGAPRGRAVRGNPR